MAPLASIDQEASDAGFTLVETLVVLSVVAVIAGLILVSTAQFSNLLALEDRTANRVTLQKTARYVAALVEQAEFVTPTDTERSGLFEGKPDAMRFLATIRRGAKTRGWRHVTVRLGDAGGNVSLIQDATPRRWGNVPNDALEQVELLHDVTVLTLSYLGAPDDRSEPVWQDHWISKVALPSAVQVKIAVGEGEERIEAEATALLAR